MAQGAIVLILFAFCVCLSCISSSAVGSGVFYACSDGTMSPGEFDFNKCLNFGTDDVLQGTDALTGLDLSGDGSDEPASTDLMGGASETLVPDGPVDIDDASGDAEFLDFFDQGSKQYISGQGTLATGVNTKAACARACYSDEVPMKDELDTCMGFISDGRGRCILYPSQDKVAGTNLPGREKSYTLKRPKDGAVTFHTFSQKTLQTNYGPNGGPKSFSNSGTTHDVDCRDPETRNFGLMTGFRFNPRGTQVNVTYGCLFNNAISQDRENSTPHAESGAHGGCPDTHRNDFNYMSKHDVNCGNSFITRWKHRQWSQSMAVDYNCSKQETGDPLGCSEYETVGDFGQACNASDMSAHPVRCPANQALTQFKWNGAGKIKFTCCPKPAPGMREIQMSKSNQQASAARDAPAANTANAKCKNNSPFPMSCSSSSINCNQYTDEATCEQIVLDVDKCCKWTG